MVGATAGVADGEPQPGQRGENFFVVWELGQNATIYPDSLTYDLDIPGNKETVISAMHPSGYQETINCAGYNHNWVKVYYYEDDVTPLLPRGTILKVTAWYDNTAANPRVIDPRNWKGWGSRSIDDMFFLNSRVVWLTDEEYEAEAAARVARAGAPAQDDDN